MAEAGQDAAGWGAGTSGPQAGARRAAGKGVKGRELGHIGSRNETR